MNDNLLIYNQIKEVPQEAQKKITGGRLNGMTDIKPMWRIEKLTEIFGSVGIGWYTKTTNKEIIDGANGEKIAIVDIELYVNYKKPYELEENMWSIGIEGSGGSSFIAKEKNGLYTNDECFKMAYTDALSVACKSLGMGANIYWGDSKYNTKEITEEDAKQYRFPDTSKKAPNKTILEVYEENPSYLQWCLDQGKDENVKKMILMLTDLKQTDVPTTEEEQTKKLYLLDKLNKLVHDTGTNYANMLKHYKVKTNGEMKIEQLEDAISKLESKIGE